MNSPPVPLSALQRGGVYNAEYNAYNDKEPVDETGFFLGIRPQSVFANARVLHLLSTLVAA